MSKSLQNKELTPVVVVVVPLPAQGHLNQLLHLSRLISSRGIPVHYVGTETHNRQAKNRIQGWDLAALTKTNLLHFHDLPPFPPQLPNINLPPTPTPPLYFPNHLVPLFKACYTNHFRKPLSSFLRSLSPTARKLVVIHDFLMSFAAHEASLLPNAESYSFYAGGGFQLFHSMVDSHNSLASPSSLDYFPSEFLVLLGPCFEFLKFSHGYLCNTCDAIDAKFMRRTCDITDFQFLRIGWAVGPLNPISVAQIDSPAMSVDTNNNNNNNNDKPRDKCLVWLDRQEPDSVIYVSFGTMTSMSNEQITELALGLERSEQRFIWVVRDADRGVIYGDDDDKEGKRRMELPDGFEKRVSERGLIVRDWVPQLEILAHTATGGFVSHCGWNSCVESMSLGVPIAAWPMHSDQPWNAILVSEVLKVGLVAREWSKREELCSWGCVESVVRRLMASEEGNELRKRARELSLAIREAIREGGASARELDSFLAHVSREQ